MGQRVCFIRHRHHPGDARMDNQVQALVDAGYSVDVLCMRHPGQPFHEVQGAVRIYRLPALAHQRTSKLRYVAEYGSFLLESFLALTLLHAFRRYRLVHVATLPDFLVFAALVAKLFGAKVLLDLRECAPEMYRCKYGISPDSAFLRMLIFLEQRSIRFADLALTCTEQMRQVFIGRGADAARIVVMLNAANAALFKDPVLPDPDGGANGTFRLVTHGTITKRYGHEVLLNAMARVVRCFPEVRLEIMGLGEEPIELRRLVTELGLEEAVTFVPYLPADELVRRLRTAHCGVVPMIRDCETDLIHTYKMQEFMALGIPVIITRSTAVEAYYDDTCLCFVGSGDPEDLATAIVKLREQPRLRYELAKNALQVYQKYNAAGQKALYVRVVRDLLAEGS